MLELTVRNVIPVAILDTLGLILNLWLLYTVKVRIPLFNAIDVLQVIKIVLVLLALVVSVWLEFLPCTELTSVFSAKMCIEAQELSDDCFFHTICGLLMTVALVRKKVCECRGRAAVLITRRYGLKTLMLCLTPACLFIAISGSLFFQAGPHEQDLNTTPGNGSQEPSIGLQAATASVHNSITFVVCHTLILDFLPLTLLCFLYVSIYRVVKQTAMTASELVQIRNRDPSKNIIHALIIHVTLACTLWSIYSGIRIASVVLGIDHLYMVLMKLVILSAHPFGEGLLQPYIKKPSDFIHRGIQDRFNRQVFPSQSAASFSDFGTMNVPLHLHKRSPIEGGWVNSPSCQKHRKVSIRVAGGHEYEEMNGEVDRNRNQPKHRKQSREELRKALQVLGGRQNGITQMRRLSTTLRFSTTEVPEENLYDSYNMHHSPVLSNCRRQSQFGNNFVCEGYSSDEKNGRKCFEFTESSPKTPKRRWKRLINTANTVRRFSRSKQRKANRLEACAEETENTSPVNSEVTSMCTPHNSPSIDKGKDIKSITSISSQHMQANDTNLVCHKGTARVRSISCVNSVYSQPQEEGAVDMERRSSLNNHASLEATASGDSQTNFLRSFSCDARIYLQLGASKPKPNPRQVKMSGSRYSRYSRENVTVDENATRKECIKKLLEMREYF